ncbi:MAG TPA: AAA family ATPase, partial [Blastocatellia bacterium]
MSEDNYKPELVEAKRNQFVMISGCSGGGKSALIGELARRGYRVFHEPGRQIVKEQVHIDGPALPWSDV